jgi:hypothetical protein
MLRAPKRCAPPMFATQSWTGFLPYNRRAHNPKVGSSNLPPATNNIKPGSHWAFLMLERVLKEYLSLMDKRNEWQGEAKIGKFRPRFWPRFSVWPRLLPRFGPEIGSFFARWGTKNQPQCRVVSIEVGQNYA